LSTPYALMFNSSYGSTCFMIILGERVTECLATKVGSQLSAFRTRLREVIEGS
jgi:hypothetical protein